MEKNHEEWDSEKECLPEGITLEELKIAKETYYSKEPKAVIDAICDGKNKYVVILGDPGSGKSTLTRYIALSLLHANEYEDEKLNKWFNAYLPFLIELREFAGLCSENKCKTFLNYFQYLAETQGCRLKKRHIENYLRNNGKALLIFDGLDEIFDPEEWAKINRMIVGFAH